MEVTLKSLAEFLFQRRCLKEIVSSDSGDLSRIVSDVCIDSRLAKRGALFCCLDGTKRRGVEFAQDAAKSGAIAVIANERILNLDIPQLIVTDTKEASGLAAAYFHGLPASKLLMIGVTGTNGKSTTAYLIRSILKAGGMKCGLIGTIIYHDGTREEEADRTTPQAPLIQSLLSRMVQNGCHACVMEASSHGIEQKRIAGCLYDRAVFTNLTPEHLDYHGNMDNYFAAKKGLFERHMRGSWKVSTNIDDPYGKAIQKIFEPYALEFAIHNKSEGMISGFIIDSSIRGIVMGINLPGSLINVSLPLLGEYNAYNSLAAASTAWSLGFSPDVIKAGLESCPPVPGRLERYFVEDGPVCVIDYAHTPDALEKVASTIKPLCDGKIWLVFGHGGDRFRENRPLLGRVAASLADHIVVTMDNPRSEDPEDIALQIVDGIKSSLGNPEYRIIIDRKQAVHFALDNAKAGDVVLITGKGPERQIIFKDHTMPYSDYEALKDWCNLRGKRLL